MSSEQFGVTRYYFTLYFFSSVVVSYLPIWLAGKGLSDSEIGYINSLPMLLILLSSILVGRIADRAPDWKQTIVVGNLLAFVASLFVGFANGFVAVLVIWAAATVPAGLVGPVADGATMRLATRQGFSFGTVRAWGTVGYLLMCFACGYLILWLGPASFPWLVAAAAGIRALNALLLPRMRAQDSVRETAPAGGLILSTEFRTAMQPWVLLPLIGGGLIFATHMVMNGFSSLTWKEQGFGEEWIGMLIAFGAVAEAASMFVWRRLQSRFAARHLILIAALAAIFRWSAMAMAPPLWFTFVLQLLQGVTFTFSFLGCLYFIANRTSDRIAAEAQSFFGVLQQLSSVIVVTGFGYGFERIGPLAFFGPALISFGVAVLVLISLRLKPAAAVSVRTSG